MASLTFTEKLGLIEEVLKFQESNAELLKSAGYDAVARAGSLKQKRDIMVAENEKQERMKAEAKEQTKKVRIAEQDAYTTASGDLDAMAGVLGKDKEISKQIKKLRSKIKKAKPTKNKTKE